MKLMQLAPLFFGRFTFGADTHRTRLTQRSCLFAFGDTLLRFGIQQLRFGGTTAHHRQRLDVHGTLFKADTDLQLIANSRLFARLAALTPAMHLAAFNRRLGQRTSLVKTRRP